MQDGIHIRSEGFLFVLHIDYAQFLQCLFLAFISISLCIRGRNIGFLLGIKLQDAIARSHIEHAALETECIDAYMIKGMGSKMAIVMIAVITVESVIGSKPDDAIGILSNRTNRLSTIKGGVDESLRMKR